MLKKLLILSVVLVALLFFGFNVFGATFGNTQKGTINLTLTPLPDYRVWGGNFYLSEKGEISDLVAYLLIDLEYGVPPFQVKGAIYDSEKNFVAETQEIILTDEGWKTLTFTSPPILESGDYYLVVISLNRTFLKALSWGNSTKQTLSEYAFPSVFNFGIENFMSSIYATYEPYVPPPPPPPPPPPFSFIPISTDFASSTLAYVGQAVSGLGPLLYVVAGIPFAFWVIKKVLSLIPKK